MRDYAGFLTNSITGFRNHTTGTDHVHGMNDVGCTDRRAVNFNPNAFYEDGSCIFLTDAKAKKGERVNFRRVSGGNEYGFSSSGCQSNGFTEGAPTSQPIAASFSNACGCAG
tara:strand:- start:30 stop:365 length:336 start_codon:yes stop_codon:yes gene_type:complete